MTFGLLFGLTLSNATCGGAAGGRAPATAGTDAHAAEGPSETAFDFAFPIRRGAGGVALGPCGEPQSTWPTGSRERAGVGVLRLRASEVERACEGGDDCKCELLGLIFEAPDPRLPWLRPDPQPQDLDRAARLYDIACRRGHARSCTGLTRAHVARGDRAGDSTQTRTAAARACDLGESIACEHLDALEARDLASARCAAGDLDSCAETARLMRRGALALGDPEAAAEVLGRLCQEGHEPSCGAGARLVAATEVQIAIDPARLARTLHALCAAPETTSPDVCYAAATRIGPIDAALALEDLRRACPTDGTLGSRSGRACVGLADAQEHAAQAAEYRRLATVSLWNECRLRASVGSCRALATQLAQGEGEHAQAGRLFALSKLCERGGDEDACAAARALHRDGVPWREDWRPAE